MPRLATDLGSASGSCDRWLAFVDVAAAGERHRLRSERFTVRFASCFGVRFSACRCSFFRGGSSRLRMMGLRYAPRKASQFTHGFRSLCCGRPVPYGAVPVLQCTGRSQKKELGCRAQKGDLVQIGRLRSCAGPALRGAATSTSTCQRDMDLAVCRQMTGNRLLPPLSTSDANPCIIKKSIAYEDHARFFYGALYHLLQVLPI